jgi:hypothetical protein
MNNRTVTAGLWFLSLTSLGMYAEFFLGVPMSAGFVLGLAVGALVALDATGRARGALRRPTPTLPGFTPDSADPSPSST